MSLSTDSWCPGFQPQYIQMQNNYTALKADNQKMSSNAALCFAREVIVLNAGPLVSICAFEPAILRVNGRRLVILVCKSRL